MMAKQTINERKLSSWNVLSSVILIGLALGMNRLMGHAQATGDELLQRIGVGGVVLFYLFWLYSMVRLYTLQDEMLRAGTRRAATITVYLALTLGPLCLYLSKNFLNVPRLSFLDGYIMLFVLYLGVYAVQWWRSR